MTEKTTAEYAADIEYLFHVDHKVPMEKYTSLIALKEDLAKLMLLHVESAVKEARRELQYEIASNLKEHVGAIVLGKGDYGR